MQYSDLFIDFIYPHEEDPLIAFVQYQGQRYVVGIRQQIHQQAIMAYVSAQEMIHVHISNDGGLISEREILGIKQQVTNLKAGGCVHVAMTHLFAGDGPEIGHTTHVMILPHSNTKLFMTMINQSGSREGNHVYQPAFLQIQTAIGIEVGLIGSLGNINGLIPLGNLFNMCMESGLLFQQKRQELGNDGFINVLRDYAQAYEIQETTPLSYEQIMALPQAQPFAHTLQDLIALRVDIGNRHRASLEIQQGCWINGEPQSADNLLDNSIIPPTKMLQYLAGQRPPVDEDHALEQNILETLPIISLTELAYPDNIKTLLSSSLHANYSGSPLCYLWTAEHIACDDTFCDFNFDFEKGFLGELMSSKNSPGFDKEYQQGEQKSPPIDKKIGGVFDCLEMIEPLLFNTSWDYVNFEKIFDEDGTELMENPQSEMIFMAKEEKSPTKKRKRSFDK